MRLSERQAEAVHSPSNERTARCGLPLEGVSIAGDPLNVTCVECRSKLIGHAPTCDVVVERECTCGGVWRDV